MVRGALVIVSEDKQAHPPSATAEPRRGTKGPEEHAYGVRRCSEA